MDQGALCILTAYCARGSLEDVLANEDLHLDNMFVSSLVADILKVLCLRSLGSGRGWQPLELQALPPPVGLLVQVRHISQWNRHMSKAEH